MCDDLGELLDQMKILKVKCSKVQRLPWGLLTKIKLPGGGDLGIYQPLHRAAEIHESETSRKKNRLRQLFTRLPRS